MSISVNHAISQHNLENIKQKVIQSFNSKEKLQEIEIAFNILQKPNFVFFENLNLKANDPIFTNLTACFYLQQDCNYLSLLNNKHLQEDVQSTNRRGTAYKLLTAKAEFGFLKDIGLAHFKQQTKYGHGYELTMAEVGLSLSETGIVSSPNKHSFFAIASLMHLSRYISFLLKHFRSNSEQYKSEKVFKHSIDLTISQRLIQNSFLYANENHQKELENYINRHIDTIKEPYLDGSYTPPHRFKAFYTFAEDSALRIWQYELSKNLNLTYPITLANLLDAKFHEYIEGADPNLLPATKMLKTPASPSSTAKKLWPVIEEHKLPITRRSGHKKQLDRTEFNKRCKAAKVTSPFRKQGSR